MPTELVAALIGAGAALLVALIGIGAGALISWKVEERKWNRERSERVQHDQREAYARVLEAFGRYVNDAMDRVAYFLPVNKPRRAKPPPVPPNLTDLMVAIEYARLVAPADVQGALTAVWEAALAVGSEVKSSEFPRYRPGAGFDSARHVANEARKQLQRAAGAQLPN